MSKFKIIKVLKRYEEAIALYLQIEKMQPLRYSTASNIGTAYELIGQNENALKWIKRSVAINAKSHYHSEWIHVKILEAKIKGENFITTSFLLNADFGNESYPKSQSKNEDLEDLATALFYQLNERISFVKPKEKIVAQLLFDLGNIAFLLGNYNDAKADYEQAIKYGFSSRMIENRMRAITITMKIQNLDKINKEIISSIKNIGKKSKAVISLVLASR